jgi:hypothetical protein
VAVEKPYTDGPHHVVMARTAEHFRADIEAVLVEEELSTSLTSFVIALMDAYELTVWHAIAALRPCLRTTEETP